MNIQPAPLPKAAKGVNPLTYWILQDLWWEHRYVSNFTIQTMGMKWHGPQG